MDFQPPLPRGDRCVYCPSVAGAIKKRTYLDAGLARLRACGAEFRIDDRALSCGHPFLAGPDADRRHQLLTAFTNPDVGAILCARGGYGAIRLLGATDWSSLATTRRLFAGFSDITALHLALNQQGLMTLHAPVVTAIGAADTIEGPRSAERVVAAISGGYETPETLTGNGLVAGSASGPLIGGNLSLLAACLPIIGLPPGCILLVEDVSEPAYRLDRMVVGLCLAGLLDSVAGIALGSFRDCPGAEQALDGLVALGVPMVTDLPIGHQATDRPVPLGATADLDGSTGELVVHWEEFSR